MEEFDNVMYDIFLRYYNILEYKGYIKDPEVFRIILASFICKLLHNYSEYMTEKDYLKLDLLMFCMFGKSCIIPYMLNNTAIPTLYTETLLVYSTSNTNKNGGYGRSRLASL